jgi:hypothetical protein
MHAAFLGVCRQITRAWFESKNHQEAFYIRPDKQKALDEQLCSILPPQRVSRTTRSISTNYPHYKAHEWEMWLLYYSPNLLGPNQLPDNYVVHWLCFVLGIALLMQERLSSVAIEKSKNCLERFCSQVSSLYGKNHETFNVHLLRHFPYYAKQYGPLQCFCMYPFENFNMTLTKYVHGSQHVASQVARRYISDIKNRQQKMNLVDNNKSLGWVLGNKIKSGAFTVDAYELFDKVPTVDFGNIDSSLFHEYLAGDEVPLVFLRAHKNLTFFHSKNYLRPIKRCSYYALISTNKIMEIHYFLVMGEPKEVYCFGMCYECTRNRKIWYLLQPHTSYKACVKFQEVIDVVMKLANSEYNETRFVQFINSTNCNNN